MYFLPRTHAVRHRLMHTKSLYRYGITGSCLFVLTGIWFCAVYTFLDSRIVQAQTTLKLLGDQEQLLAQSSKDIVHLTAQVAIHCARLQEIKKENTGMTLQSAMIALINKAGACGLSMRMCTVTDQKDEKWYTKNSVQFEVNGSFDQLSRYIQLVSADHHLMAITHLTLNHLNDTVLFNAQCGLDIIELKREQSDFVA